MFVRRLSAGRDAWRIGCFYGTSPLALDGGVDCVAYSVGCSCAEMAGTLGRNNCSVGHHWQRNGNEGHADQRAFARSAQRHPSGDAGPADCEFCGTLGSSN